MKTKIVLWGENEKEEKILLGIELLSGDNVIRIHMIPEQDATEIFYNQMMNQWRQGQHIPMPASCNVIDRPLSMTEGLLPDNIKTQRQDILARAKTEWHFVVLSSKLYQSYADEIAQIKERIEELSDFDGGIWEEMKGFWSKVQEQVREKHLFREHASELRTKTNELFDKLKDLKKVKNDEFEKRSKLHVDSFFEKLQTIEEKIEKGLGLQPIFNQLKDLQNVFKDTSFTRKHHNEVWKRLDGAFKKIKEKKYGKAQPGTSSAQVRLTRRYEGLVAAIAKMEQSINRDDKDKKFQVKRINTTDGQLELQIRQAKMAMIEERIISKRAKLDDMLKTREELEKKIEFEKQKAEEIKEKKELTAEVKKATATVKEKIATEIEQKAEGLKAEDAKLKKAAESIKESKQSKKSKSKVDVPPVVPEIKKDDSETPKVFEALMREPASEESEALESEDRSQVPVAIETSETPKSPEVPEAKETTDVETVSEESEVPEATEAPKTPEAPVVSNVIEQAKASEEFEAPEVQEEPGTPETSEVEQEIAAIADADQEE